MLSPFGNSQICIFVVFRHVKDILLTVPSAVLWCDYDVFLNYSDIRQDGFMTPCSVAVGYQRFGGSCCLHLQGEGLRNVRILSQHYTASQPRRPWIFNTVQTSSLILFIVPSAVFRNIWGGISVLFHHIFSEHLKTCIYGIFIRDFLGKLEKWIYSEVLVKHLCGSGWSPLFVISQAESSAPKTGLVVTNWPRNRKSYVSRVFMTDPLHQYS